MSGRISDFERWEAFISDLMTVRGRLGWEFIGNSGDVRALVLGGGTFWIPTDDGDSELFGDVMGQIWVHADQFMIGAALSGRAWLTEPNLDLGEGFSFQLGFGAIGAFGRVRPGLHFHVPLGDDGLIQLGRAVDVVYGINVTLLLGETSGSGLHH